MELTTWIIGGAIILAAIWLFWELRNATYVDEFGQPIKKPTNKKR